MLTLLRWEGNKPYPANWHEIWCDCRGRRLEAIGKIGGGDVETRGYARRHGTQTGKAAKLKPW